MREFNCEDNATYVPGQKKITPTGTIEITENGTFDVAQYASADVNVSGGGGANAVSGTFLVEGSETTMQIKIPYTGDGYPIACLIFPVGGFGRYEYDSARDAYGLLLYSMTKYMQDTVPDYGVFYENQNRGSAFYMTMPSDSPNYNLATKSFSPIINGRYSRDTQPSERENAVVFSSADTMLVYVRQGTRKNGFIKGLEYGYVVLYSE